MYRNPNSICLNFTPATFATSRRYDVADWSCSTSQRPGNGRVRNSLSATTILSMAFAISGVCSSATGVPPAFPCDYNNNGICEAADYTVWRDHLGQNFALQNEGAEPFGFVDQADYDFWSERFGQMAGRGSGTLTQNSAGIPEPASWVLAGSMTSLLSFWRRRCR